MLPYVGVYLMHVQSLQEKQELVAMYNELCSTLLGVQVTLSQNRPQSMTAQDRIAAAARFQNSMQVPISNTLGSAAMSTAPVKQYHTCACKCCAMMGFGVYSLLSQHVRGAAGNGEAEQGCVPLLAGNA